MAWHISEFVACWNCGAKRWQHGVKPHNACNEFQAPPPEPSYCECADPWFATHDAPCQCCGLPEKPPNHNEETKR